MKRFKALLDELKCTGKLSGDGWLYLLSGTAAPFRNEAASLAEKITLEKFGNKIFVRGIVEFSNFCSNDCFYCGIRCSNKKAARYRLEEKEILECCSAGYEYGFRTFVLQSGEDAFWNSDRLAALVKNIKAHFPACAVTLSVGELERSQYQQLFDAGCDRYLLRHETFNEKHYQELHPSEMNRKHRLLCLQWLKIIGYQTGTGIMVGSPGQTVDHLVEDIQFIERFQPEMIGIGPFIPHADTPFANHPSGSIDMTLKLISIFRLMHPSALIPATTALATLSTDGRERGILAGANVVMPNLSPSSVREKYSLYNNKAAFGSEAAEGLKQLEMQLEKIGYTISYLRGDYKLCTNPNQE